jgi:hypothetical protein
MAKSDGWFKLTAIESSEFKLRAVLEGLSKRAVIQGFKVKFSLNLFIYLFF